MAREPLPANLSKVPKAFAPLAARINALLDLGRVLAAVQGRGGITATLTDGNYIIDGEALARLISSNSGGSTFYHPFKVVLTDAAGPTAAIIAESRLYNALYPVAATSISSLTSSITLTSTTKVWLKGTVNSSLVITAATITTTNPSDLITIGGGGTQTEFHVLIGKVASGANADAPGFDFQISGVDYHFEQTCFTHLLAENRCNNGVPIVYPFPFTGA